MVHFASIFQDIEVARIRHIEFETASDQITYRQAFRSQVKSLQRVAN